MDLGSFSLSVCFVIVSLQGAVWSSNGDNPGCPCPQIPTKCLTVPPEPGCRQINDRYRYKCVEGYVRKVGTSSLSVCKEINGAAQWTPSDLVCIPDPTRVPPVPPQTCTLITSTGPKTAGTSTSAPGSEDPTSPAVTPQTELRTTSSVTGTGAANGTKIPVSTTADPSGIGTLDSHVGSDVRTTAAVVCVLLLIIVCALMGVGFVCYKRRSAGINPPHSPEELVSMNLKKT